MVSLCLAGGLLLAAGFSGGGTALAAQTPKRLAVPDAANPTGTSAAPSVAQSRIPVPAGSIRIENDTPNLVYYTVLPFKPAELNQLLSQPKSILEKLKAARDKLVYLPPRTVAGALPVNELEQLVLGFTLENAANSYKVWYLRVPTKGMRPGVPVFFLSQSRPLADAAGVILDLSSIDFVPPVSAVRIDGRFVDWLKYDDLLFWSDRNPPVAVKRQQADSVTGISLAASQFWGKAGTDLEHFRMIKSPVELLVMVSSRSLMSKGLSYLVRVYDSATAKAPSAVLEIPMDAPTGPALAWEAGKAEPRLCGEFATADYYLEARFRLSDLPANLGKFAGKDGKDWYFELSSSFSQPGQSEEFFAGRFAASSIRQVE